MKTFLPTSLFALSVALGSVSAAAAQTSPATSPTQTDPNPEFTAQSSDKSAGADIVVTAARGQGTRDARQQNLQTVDAIGARDIDSLPSQNISDVLKRLPGVQVTYDNGEAQQPNIRGVQFIQTLVDGRETVTANARALQIGDVPADIVNGVDVFKSQSADMIEGGIGGVIALKTKQPFDYSRPAASGQVSLSMDDKRGKPLPQGSIAVGGSWQTGIGRIGASIGVAHTAVSLRSDFFISGYNRAATVFDLNRNGAVGDAADTAIYPSLGLPIEINARHSRDSIVANLQWAPSDELDLRGSFFHSEYLDESQQYLVIAAPGTTNSAANFGAFSLVPDSPTATPIVRDGTFANVPITSQSLYVRPNRTVWQQNLAARWTRGPLTLSAQGDFTQSSNDNDILIFAASSTAPGLTYTGARSPGRGSIAVSGVDITNPAIFGGMSYTEILQRNDSHGNSQRVDVEYRPEGFFLTALQAGYRHTSRRSTANQANANNALAGTIASIPGLAGSSPDGDFAVANPLLFQDKLDFRRMVGLPAVLPANNPASFFRLRETTNAGYARALYAFDLGGVSIDGDVGVRVIQSRNRGSAFAIAANGTATPVTNAGSTTDWLPSATLRAGLTERLTLRLSGSRTMARPAFTQLSPGLTLNADLTGSGGNPDLRSFYADGADAGLDWFFAPSGYATVAVFYKKLDGLITTFASNETINGLNYRIIRPINGSANDSFKGIEVNLNKKFVELPGLLSGIGFDANYTYIDSRSTNAAGRRTQIPFLAQHTFNGSVYYDRGPLLARVGYAITSKLINNPNFGGLAELGGQEIFGRQDVMDATVQYRLTDNFRLTANVLNALQPDVGYYNGFRETPNNSYKTYRRYQLGLKFEFK